MGVVSTRDLLEFICSRSSVTVHEIVEEFVERRHVDLTTLYHYLKFLVDQGLIRRPVASIYVCRPGGVATRLAEVLEEVLRSCIQGAKSRYYSISISYMCREIERRRVAKCSSMLREDLRRIFEEIARKYPGCIEVVRKKRGTQIKISRTCLDVVCRELRHYLDKA